MTERQPEKYTLKVEEGVREALSSLPPSLQEKITSFWRDHLVVTPHRPPIGGVKRLKGQWSEYYQYDIDRHRGMLYRIDDDQRIVYVDYIGSHPDWDKRHDWR